MANAPNSTGIKLPLQYSWLGGYDQPPLIAAALPMFGVTEAPGDADNPVILAWAQELGLANVYNHDSIPWCGLFMAIVVKRADLGPAPAHPLWALDWQDYGLYATPGPWLGDVLVFVRPGGGHVGIYVGEDQVAYHVLGGNEGNAVSIVRVSKLRLHSYRRPAYTVPPDNLSTIALAMTGELSTNEA